MARMISNTRKFVNRMLRAHVVGLTVQSVLNVGAIPEHKDKEGGKYRDYFPDAAWYTLDFRKRENDPHHYTVDLHDVSSIDQRFDLILNISTLEHVKNPFVVVDNLRGLLNPRGYMFIAVPWRYKLHGLGYGDYWRFTHMAIRELHKGMEEIMLELSPKDTDQGYCALFRSRQ